MATLFDFIIVHESKTYAQQAAWEAIKEIDRLENELSRFKPNSDISRFNNLKKGERTILSFDAFNCIKRGIELYETSHGAFNIACGSLLKCWLNYDYSLKNTNYNEVESALIKSRIENIVLYHEDFSIEIVEEGTTIDLGAYGKGYAIDAVAEILSEWNIDNALLSAGRSSIKAIGKPYNLPGWNISMSDPARTKEVFRIFSLSDISLGASGITKGSHIINTLTGEPEVRKSGSWVFAQNCAEADALSTAFMILNNEQIKNIVDEMKTIGAIVIENTDTDNYAVYEFGLLPPLAHSPNQSTLI
jgi:thiamine biosynthesis lipoprotein